MHGVQRYTEHVTCTCTSHVPARATYTCPCTCALVHVHVHGHTRVASRVALVIYLKKNSLIDFTIYEKQDCLSFEEGYGIQLSVNCISILRELDFDLIKQEDCYNPKKINLLSFNNKLSSLIIYSPGLISPYRIMNCD